jgi:hypothetical protein
LVVLAQAPAADPPANDLLAPLTAPALRVDTSAPVFAARYESSDAAMNAKWNAAVSSMESRRRAGFTPDVFGSMGPFWGDAYAVGRAYATLAGDPSVLRAGIERVLRPAAVPDPATDGRPLAAYTLLWPRMLLAYYEFTGDQRFTRELADFALSEWLTYFEAARGESGLIEGERIFKGQLNWITGFPAEASPKANSVINAIYCDALDAAAAIARAVGFDAAIYESAAARIADAYRAQLLEPSVGLFRDAPGFQSYSALGNALAFGAKISAPEQKQGIVALIQRDCATFPDLLAPLAAEACFRAGENELGYHVIASVRESAWNCSVLYLLPEYVAGVAPGSPGWKTVRLAPSFPTWVTSADMQAPLPAGRVTLTLAPGKGSSVILPPGLTAMVDATRGESVMLKNAATHARNELSAEHAQRLASYGWADRVGDQPAVWVSVREQIFRLIQSGEVVYQATCATAANGVGSEMNSMKTPAGWHAVLGKNGDGEPLGRVFRSRKATREIWKPGQRTREDLVLTRVLFLDGLEPGVNKGGDVDSNARDIYIHGTNDEANLGTPSSHGCVRLSNDDVITAYGLIPTGTLVLITED